MTSYRVTGRRRYREHEPGEIFDADLPSDVEARAISRGAVEIVDTEPVSLQPGSWTVADGWRTDHPDKEGR